MILLSEVKVDCVRRRAPAKVPRGRTPLWLIGEPQNRECLALYARTLIAG